MTGHTDEMMDRAALYALGQLEPREALEFEMHLQAGCSLCAVEVEAFRETATALAVDAPPLTPPPSLKDRVMAANRPLLADPMIIVRSSEGEWKPTGMDGITSKLLFYDQESDCATFLLRMQPGSVLLPHCHSRNEQCLVLEGDVRFQATVLRAGDYECARKGSNHGPITTDQGCLLLLVASPHDEINT